MSKTFVQDPEAAVKLAKTKCKPGHPVYNILSNKTIFSLKYTDHNYIVLLVLVKPDLFFLLHNFMKFANTTVQKLLPLFKIHA